MDMDIPVRTWTVEVYGMAGITTIPIINEMWDFKEQFDEYNHKNFIMRFYSTPLRDVLNRYIETCKISLNLGHRVLDIITSELHALEENKYKHFTVERKLYPYSKPLFTRELVVMGDQAPSFPTSNGCLHLYGLDFEVNQIKWCYVSRTIKLFSKQHLVTYLRSQRELHKLLRKYIKEVGRPALDECEEVLEDLFHYMYDRKKSLITRKTKGYKFVRDRFRYSPYIALFPKRVEDYEDFRDKMRGVELNYELL